MNLRRRIAKPGASGKPFSKNGSRTYPTGSGFDAAGRLTTLTTWTNFATSSGAAVTTWHYDGYRGFLTNKAYADGQGPGYTYTAAGRLQARTWARRVGGQPLTTTYGYNAAGDLATVVYSDGVTPNVTNTFDRLGRIIQVATSTVQQNSLYNDVGELLSESYLGGPLNGLSITNTYDARLRRSRLAILNSPSAILASANYGYDQASRLLSVQSGSTVATYGYVPNSPLVASVTFC
jgi:YD repeat-containing protein